MHGGLILDTKKSEISAGLLTLQINLYYDCGTSIIKKIQENFQVSK